MVLGLLLPLLVCFIIPLSSGHVPRCTLSIMSLLSYPDENPAFNPEYTDGPDIVPAGYLAVEMINNRSDILSGYELELVETRAGCGTRTRTLSEKTTVYNVFLGRKRIIGAVGPHCYDAAERVGQIFAKDDVALVNVHLSSSPSLSTPSMYPYSIGTTPSLMTKVDAYASLISHYGWEQAPIAFLFEDSDLSQLMLTYLNTTLNKSSRIAYSSIVTNNNIHTVLMGLESSGARLVLVNVNGILVQKLICLAMQRNIIYPKYLWSFLQNALEEFTYIEFEYMGKPYSCSHREFSLALNSSLALNFSYTPRNIALKQKGISGLTKQQFDVQYSEAVKRYNAGNYGVPAKTASVSKLGTIFHDAIWVLALALNVTDTKLKRINQSLCEYGYGQPDLTKQIQEEILNVNFMGAGGVVSYKYNGTRFSPPGIVNVWIHQDSGGIGQTVKLGCFDLLGSFYPQKNVTFFHISQQKRQFRAFYDVFFQIGAAIAFFMTVSIHVMNVVFRDQSLIKASSHRLNHVAYVGCYLLIGTVVVFSVTETYLFSRKVKAILCDMTHWTGTIGFTLIYGTVCTKLYRIYNLLIVSVKRFQLPSMNDKLLSDKNLILVILALTIPDIVICGAWTILDPVAVTSISKLEADTEQLYVVTVESCLANTTSMPLVWCGLLFGYLCLLGNIGAVIAFLTRSISLKQYKTDNIAILSVLLFISACIAVPIYGIGRLVYENPVDAHALLFVTIVTLLLVFVYLCLFLLFLPPILPLLKTKIFGWIRRLVSLVSAEDQDLRVDQKAGVSRVCY